MKLDSHVEIYESPRGYFFCSPRRRETFPPKFHLILPKNFFLPTWRFEISYVEISFFMQQKRIKLPEILFYNVAAINFPAPQK